jgi:hypothetical protein
MKQTLGAMSYREQFELKMWYGQSFKWGENIRNNLRC